MRLLDSDLFAKAVLIAERLADETGDYPSSVDAHDLRELAERHAWHPLARRVLELLREAGDDN
jgi:hypothetical protein